LPELPEVETVVRSLAPFVAGRRIVEARFLAPRAAGGRPDEVAARLEGRTITGLRRLGKHILFDLDKGVIDVHLRMTGKLLYDAAAGAYARAVLILDRGTLVFDDVRQFGYVVWRESDPAVGRDAMDLDETEFVELVRGRRGAIKPLLLNQAVIAGLGNIYVDEALFRAGVHPLARGVSRPRLKRLHAAVLEVLSEAIEAGGSSISNYVDAEGRRGSFQERHRVYGRAGEPCVICGAVVRRIVVGQRGTHYCPRCQRRV
jgi:formamidopyrimidine-DNA glycosylase